MKELQPESTSRALAYSMFIDAPQPTVTMFKTLDITRLYRFAKRGERLNAMLCYTAGLAALEIPEFKLRVKDKRLFALDEPFLIGYVTPNKEGGIGVCDVPLCATYKEFRLAYERLGKELFESCQTMNGESVLLGTSAVVTTELDGIVNMYSEAFCNPFLAWGRYKKRFLHTELKVSFQFHHVQMDGGQAAAFLESWQQKILAFRP